MYKSQRDSIMQLSQEQIRALCYQPLWYNMGSEDQFLLIAILEEYIEANTDNYLLHDAKVMLEMIKKPLVKEYKDVIHCGVNH